MSAGRLWPAERRTFRDPETDAEIIQWTAHKGHSHHLYFTNPGWWDGGRRLLFGSDRENRTNLFSVELATGVITQLTDLDMPPPPAETSFLFASVNPVRDEAYFWHGPVLKALDLRTLAQRDLAEAPPGFLPNMTNVTADGRAVCTVVYEDLTGRFEVDLLHGYRGFREYWAARPVSRVLAVDAGGGGARTVFEERAWIGHVNTSPVRPGTLTFCHEGPWEEVDQRIWGLDLDTGRAWRIRPTAKGEQVGHEYWLADGERIGYHGDRNGQAFFGFAAVDDASHREFPAPGGSWHYFSLDDALVIGDGHAGEPFLMLWQRAGVRFTAPRRLLRHGGSFHTQQTHVHPRFSPDGRTIVYTTDASGYGQVCSVTVPPFDRLPPSGG